MNYLFYQLTRSFGIFFRTIRAFFVRQATAVTTRVRQMTNLSRNAMLVANSSLKMMATAVKKPSQREDYVETRQLFIAKGFLVKLALLLVSLGLIGYFLVWPFILSRFFTVRFYVEDSRLPGWTGRVIVYADEGKTVPMYAGRLEDGVLQGKGEGYDEEGLLAYEGPFVDGTPSGEGTAYEAGVLCYEGQFAAGVYEGRGRLYKDGALYYEGDFAAGVPSGEGVAYHPNGQAAYKGQFAAGVYEGEGAAYDSGGALLYEGGFAGGLYSGSGRLYLDRDQWITAEFQEGEVAGVVQWYKGARLYYEGEWAGSRPHGYGALYSKAGQPLYQGQFSRGTLDGAWLLELPVEELRAALGGTAATAGSAGGGFLIQSAALGLTALCSYQTEEAEPAVYAVYLSAPQEAGWVQLLPGTRAAGLPEWPAGATQRRGEASFAPLEGMQLTAGTYEALAVTAPDYEASCLYDANGDAVLLSWRQLGTAPGVLDLSALTDGSGSGAQMDAFLAALDLADGSAAEAAAENPYYGEKDPAEGLALCTSLQQAEDMLNAMLLYWEQAERQVDLEENLARAQELLAEAQRAQAMADADDAAVAALEDEIAGLESAVQSCQAQRALAQLQGQAAGIEDISVYAVDQVLLCFDPSVEDSSQFALAATAFAQATGGDVSAAKLAGMTSVVNLTEDYSQVQTALGRYEAAQAAAQSAAGAYATGTLDKAGWYDALSAQADARSTLCGALAAFGREANTLNMPTGGWVTENYAWYPDQLDPLFQAAAEALQAAEAEEEEAPAGVWEGWNVVQALVSLFRDSDGNPLYGDGAPADALAGCKKLDKAADILDTMFAYWELAERQNNLEQELARTRELLEEAGVDEALQAQAGSLEAEIRSCLSHRLLLDVQAKAAGVLDITAYDLGDVLIYFDPVLLDSNKLAQAASEAALAAGEDAAEARVTLMTSLASLTEDYNAVQAARRSFEAARDAAAEAQQAFEDGAGSKAAWYAALSAQTAAQNELSAALAAFGREVNQINMVTGGWITQNFGWYSGELGPLFEEAAENAA